MKFCNRCVYPENHPLNIIFDEDGICSGCRIHEEKDFLNWLYQNITKHKSLLCIYVTHDFDEIKKGFQKVLALKKGKFIKIDSVKNILKMDINKIF